VEERRFSAASARSVSGHGFSRAAKHNYCLWLQPLGMRGAKMLVWGEQAHACDFRVRWKTTARGDQERVLYMCKVRCKVQGVKRNFPALHLRNAPLIYVVAQVRFSPIVSIEKFVPEIQEKLRHKGFPRFVRVQVPEITIQPDGTPKLNVVERFEFQDKVARLGIVLQSNSLAVHTNNYSNYEAFEEVIKTALMAVHRVVSISLAERIGLRYVNLIRLQDGEKWADYVHEGFLGLEPRSVGVKHWLSRSEALGPTKIGKLAIRCTQSEQAFPPDLLTSTLQYSMELAKGEIVTTLDFDHFVEVASDFRVADAIITLERLHESLDLVFAKSVTADALKKWGRVEEQNAKHH
jgi:uncharacterized protein (TIGR04255 family)